MAYSRTFTNEVGIEITVSGASEGAKGIDTLTKSLQKLKEAASATSTITPKIENTTSAFAKLGKILKGAGILVAVRQISKGLGEAVNKSANYNETFNLFNVELGQYTEEASEYAHKVSDIMGIDVAEWMRNEGIFMKLTSGFGVASDRAYLMSKNLTQLGYDISSLFNEDVALSMQRLQSAIAGELEPIRKLGVDLSKAKLEAVALSLGIDKSFNAMTQAEKSQLRYVAIMEQLNDTQNDMAKTLDQPANMLRVLKSQLEMTARAIGNVFMPMVQTVLPYLIAFTRVIRSLIEGLARLVGYKEPEIKGAEVIENTTAGIADNLDTASGRAAKLKKQLAGFDEINNLTTNEPSSGGGSVSPIDSDWNFKLPEYDFLSGLVETKIGDITQSLKDLWAIIEPFVPLLVGLGTAWGVFNLLLPITSSGLFDVDTWILTAMEGFDKLWAALIKNPVIAVIALIAGLVAALIYLYNTNEDVRQKIDEILASMSETVGEFVATIQADMKWLYDNIIAPIIVPLTEEFERLWNSSLKNTIMNVGWFIRDLIVGAMEIYTNFISPIIKQLVEYFAPVWDMVWKAASGVLGTALEFISDVVGSIISIFRGIINFISGVFAGDWEKVWEGIGEIFGGIMQGLVALFKAPINLIIDGINAFIAGMNKIKIPDWVPIVGGKSLHFNYIPKLATGGVISTPTIAEIGEDGAEAVVPLEKNTGWIQAVSAEINANNNTDETNTLLNSILDVIRDFNPNPTVVIGDNEIGQANDRYVYKRTRIMGV